MAKWALDAKIAERALQFRGAGDEARWKLGDLLTEAANAAPHGRQTAAIVECAKLAGIGRAQAYRYRLVAETFPGAARAELEGLTLDQLAECARHPQPQGCAEWAIGSADDYGGWPAPVDVIRRRVTADLGKPDKAPLDEIAGLLTRAANALNTALSLCGQHFPDRDVTKLEAAITTIEQFKVK